jgi:hypothetical protein
MIDIIRATKDQSFETSVQQTRKKSFILISELAEDFMDGKDDFFIEEKSKQGCGNRASVCTRMDDGDVLILLQDFYAAEKC